MFFMNKKVEKGTNILLLWRQPGSLELIVTSDKDQDFSTVCRWFHVQSVDRLPRPLQPPPPPHPPSTHSSPLPRHFRFAHASLGMNEPNML